MAPQVGLEPTTLRLTAECSTIELLRNRVGLLTLLRNANSQITTDLKYPCQLISWFFNTSFSEYLPSEMTSLQIPRNARFPGGGSARFSEILDDRRPSGSSPFRRLPETTQLRYLASLLLGHFPTGPRFPSVLDQLAQRASFSDV